MMSGPPRVISPPPSYEASARTDDFPPSVIAATAGATRSANRYGSKPRPRSRSTLITFNTTGDDDDNISIIAPCHRQRESNASSDSSGSTSSAHYASHTASSSGSSYPSSTVIFEHPRLADPSYPGSIMTSPIHTNPTISLRTPVNISPSTSPLSANHRGDMPTYTFRPTGFNTMVLLPSPLAPDQTPLYHIAISMNCFMPTSFITTIRRGGTDQGEYVAEFEMGIIQGKSRVCFGHTEYLMDDLFGKFRRVPSLLKDRWVWTRGELLLHWDGTNEPGSRCYKFGDDTKTILARLVPPEPNTAKSGQGRVTKLEVTPTAHSFFDDILVSSLIVERKRLSPVAGQKNETLFS